MPWLDPGEDISHLLRSTHADGALPSSMSETLFDLLLLLTIFGMLLASVTAGAMQLRHRFAIGNMVIVMLAGLVRLKRRFGAAIKNLRARIEQEIEKKTGCY
jgi:hypothetical protein